MASVRANREAAISITRRTTWLGAAAAPLAISACATTTGATGALTEAGLAAWLDGYRQAWEGKDAQRAGALFTDDATYQENPHEAAMQGRAAIEAYWARVTAGQENIRFTSHVIACKGDEGVAHWRAEFTASPGGEAIVLDGVFVLRFADAAHVQSLREWWHIKVSPAAAS